MEFSGGLVYKDKNLPICLSIFCLVVLFPAVVFSNSASSNVSASITVTCPFKVGLNTSPLYIRPQRAYANYSVSGINCNIPNLFGTVSLSNISGNILYTSNQVAASNDVAFNTSGLAPGVYYLNASFRDSGFRNHTVAETQIMTDANLSISSSFVQEPILAGSHVSLSLVVSNNGSLSSNDTILRLYVSGPSGPVANFSYALSPILPASNESIYLTLPGIAPTTGSYTINGNVIYNSTYRSGNYLYISAPISSPNFSVPYTVSQPQLPPPPNTHVHVILPSTPIGNISITVFPLLSTMANGSSDILPLALYNNGDAPMWVNMSNYAIDNITLSSLSPNLYLLGHQGVQEDILASAGSTVEEGDYVIPLNITYVSPGSIPSTGRIPFEISIRNESRPYPMLFNNVVLLNRSKSASGQIKVVNPYNSPIFNSTVSLLLPLMTVKNSSDITLSGAKGNITVSGKNYLLQWDIPDIPPAKTYFVYYTISNIAIPNYLQSSAMTFAKPSQASQSTLDIIDVDAPTLYVNRSGTISVIAMYVGPNPENITFTLLAPSRVPVEYPSESFHSYPNMEMNPEFNISGVRTSGTYMLFLKVHGIGINDTYSIPMVILPLPPVSPPPSTAVSQNKTAPRQNITLSGTAQRYAEALLIAIIAIAFAAVIIKNLSRAKHNKRVLHEFRESEEHMRRGE